MNAQRTMVAYSASWESALSECGIEKSASHACNGIHHVRADVNMYMHAQVHVRIDFRFTVCAFIESVYMHTHSNVACLAIKKAKKKLRTTYVTCTARA